MVALALEPCQRIHRSGCISSKLEEQINEAIGTAGQPALSLRTWALLQVKAVSALLDSSPCLADRECDELKRMVHQCAGHAPSGVKLATACGDNKLRIMDARTMALDHRVNHGGYVFAVAYCPTGTKLATASFDRKVRVVDATTGDVELCLPHESVVKTVAWNHSGRKLASGSSDGVLRVQDARTGELEFKLRVKEAVRALAYDTTGRDRLAAGAEDGRLRIIQDGGVVAEHGCGGVVFALAWHPSGRHLAAGLDRFVRVLDADTGATVLEIPSRQEVNSVAYSLSGAQLAVGSRMRLAALRILDAETGEVQHEVPHEGAVFAVAWHPDGTQVATGCYDDKLRLINAQTGAVEQVVGHGGTVWGLAWSP